MKTNAFTHYSNINFFVIHIKTFLRNLLSLLFVLFTISLLLFSKTNIKAVQTGLTLWVNNVVPTLLPFFIATELLSYTNILYKLSKLLNPLMKPLFNVPGAGAYALILGIISGYPIGAKIVSKLKEDNLCSNVEAERLLAFTNNSGPLFIIGTVGISMFGNTLIGVLLLLTHILSCLTVGFIFRFWKYKDKSISFAKQANSQNNNIVNFSNLGEVLSKSIISSINTTFIIGGFIVLFSVILSILNNSNIISIFSKLLYPIFKILGFPNFEFINGFLSGLLELTNGLKIISLVPCKQISINIIICSFLLGFGGLSILFQVFSIISKSNISIKPYIIGKLLQGFFAVIYTTIFISTFPIFNLNL